MNDPLSILIHRIRLRYNVKIFTMKFLVIREQQFSKLYRRLVCALKRNVHILEIAWNLSIQHSAKKKIANYTIIVSSPYLKYESHIIK